MMASNAGNHVSGSVRESNYIAGLVLARGGSKEIPRKNIRFVAGRPLIGWVLESMKKTPHISKIWVSTDDNEISEVAKEYNVHVHHRNSSSAQCNSTSLESIKEFLESHPEVKIVALVQCTSPYLVPTYLNDACEMIISKGYDSVFSVYRHHKLRWKEVCFGENTVALNFDPMNRPRRQDWKGELVESGHFYIAKVDLINKGLLQGGRCGYIEIPSEYCFEIDTDKDLIVAEALLKNYFL